MHPSFPKASLSQVGSKPGSTRVTKALLLCGILSSLLYMAMNVFVPMRFPGYDSASQTVSELSAIGAPTRPLWVALGTVYTVFVAAFGWGVLRSAGQAHPLRVVGSLLIVHGLLGIFWPPMHLRGAERTLTDTMHIAFTAATVFLMILAICFGAAAFGSRFRWFSIATLVVLIGFGALTGTEAPNVPLNQPTPLIGVWERINIGAFMLWVVVVAVILLRKPSVAPRRLDVH